MIYRAKTEEQTIIKHYILNQTSLESILFLWIPMAIDLVKALKSLTQIIYIACQLVLPSVFYLFQWLPERPFQNT